jgi:hypothetical protein
MNLGDWNKFVPEIDPEIRQRKGNKQGKQKHGGKILAKATKQRLKDLNDEFADEDYLEQLEDV